MGKDIFTGYNFNEDDIMNDFAEYYERLNIDAKRAYNSKAVYIGSNDLVGYFEPSLIIKLRDSLSAEGKFTRKEPRKGKFFVYWYDKNDILVKASFYNTENESENYDVFIVDWNGVKLYLFFDFSEGRKNVKISHYYILEHKGGLLIKFAKSYFRGVNMKREYELEEYEYLGHKLSAANISTGFIDACYTFRYADNGYVESYEQYDPTIDNAPVYTTSVKKNDAMVYEKFNMYHFSPLNKKK